MKKLFSLFLLSLFFSAANCMKEGMKSSATAITILTSDGKKMTFSDNNAEALKQSNTIANLIEDYGLSEEEIPLPNVTASGLEAIFPSMKQISEIEIMSKEEQKTRKKTLIEDVQQQDLKGLIPLLENADYLDVPMLYDCCIDAVAKKFTAEKNIQEISSLFPIHILISIVKRCIRQKGFVECTNHSDSINHACKVETENGQALIYPSYGGKGTLYMGGKNFSPYGSTNFLIPVANLFDKLNTITFIQAVAICSALNTTSEKEVLLKEMKQIINNAGERE